MQCAVNLKPKLKKSFCVKRKEYKYTVLYNLMSDFEGLKSVRTKDPKDMPTGKAKEVDRPVGIVNSKVQSNRETHTDFRGQIESYGGTMDNLEDRIQEKEMDFTNLAANMAKNKEDIISLSSSRRDYDSDNERFAYEKYKDPTELGRALLDRMIERFEGNMTIDEKQGIKSYRKTLLTPAPTKGYSDRILNPQMGKKRGCLKEPLPTTSLNETEYPGVPKSTQQRRVMRTTDSSSTSSPPRGGGKEPGRKLAQDNPVRQKQAIRQEKESHATRDYRQGNTSEGGKQRSGSNWHTRRAEHFSSNSGSSGYSNDEPSKRNRYRQKVPATRQNDGRRRPSTDESSESPENRPRPQRDNRREGRRHRRTSSSSEESEASRKRHRRRRKSHKSGEREGRYLRDPLMVMPDMRGAMMPEPCSMERGENLDSFFIDFEEYCEASYRQGSTRWLPALPKFLTGKALEALTSIRRVNDSYQRVKAEMLGFFNNEPSEQQRRRRAFQKAGMDRNEDPALYLLRLERLFAEAYPRKDAAYSTQLREKFVATTTAAIANSLEIRLASESSDGREMSWHKIKKFVRNYTQMADLRNRQDNSYHREREYRERRSYAEVMVGTPVDVPKTAPRTYQETQKPDRYQIRRSPQNERKRGEQQRDRATQERRGDEQQTRNPQRCSWCGFGSHSSRDCRKRLGLCFICGSKDHFAEKCSQTRERRFSDRGDRSRYPKKPERSPAREKREYKDTGRRYSGRDDREQRSPNPRNQRGERQDRGNDYRYYRNERNDKRNERAEYWKQDNPLWNDQGSNDVRVDSRVVRRSPARASGYSPQKAGNLVPLDQGGVTQRR